MLSDAGQENLPAFPFVTVDGGEGKVFPVLFSGHQMHSETKRLPFYSWLLAGSGGSLIITHPISFKVGAFE